MAEKKIRRNRREKGIAIKIKDGVPMDDLVPEHIRFAATSSLLKSLHMLVMRSV